MKCPTPTQHQIWQWQQGFLCIKISSSSVEVADFTKPVGNTVGITVNLYGRLWDRIGYDYGQLCQFMMFGKDGQEMLILTIYNVIHIKPKKIFVKDLQTLLEDIQKNGKMSYWLVTSMKIWFIIIMNWLNLCCIQNSLISQVNPKYYSKITLEPTYVLITTLNPLGSAPMEEIQQSVDQMCQKALKEVLQQAYKWRNSLRREKREERKLKE